MNKKNTLRLRWVMSQANYLFYELQFDRRAALIQANLCWKLLEALGNGMVSFTYLKKNHQEREAIGTLNQKIINQMFKSPEKKIKKDDVEYEEIPRSFTYFDVAKKAFRSFKIENVLWIGWSVIC